MKSTNKTPNGTSYWSNNITATVTQLKAILGEPVFCDNDGSDKVNFEWNLETDNGDVFTVYDWKEYRPISEDEIIVWHIGGINGSVTIQAQSEVNAALTTQPKEPTHITWWKGLNEEEQTKLCQKHFQGIPVESLMERSIKVMYHYENPETTTNTVTGEGFTKGEWLAGEIDTYGEFHIVARHIPEDGGDIICCAPQGWEDSMKRWTANKKRIVNCVNNFDSLVSALRDTLEVIKNNCDWTKFNRQEEESTEAAKQVLNQISQL